MVSRKIVIDAAVKATKYISKEVVHGLADHGTKAVVKDFEVKAKKKVSIPSAAISYYHRNYEEVKRELEAYGFENITLLERKDLMTGVLTPKGAIEEISIDGKANFRKNAKFRSDARVVIIYHELREWS